MVGDIIVTKRSGEEVVFDDRRVIRSMERVGVAPELFDRVLAHIKEKVQADNTITTDEIFYHIREFLVRKDKKSALRFNLRQAIFELGPTGFPFEQYLAKIFRDQGYKTQVDIQMQGECVSHEIDILLQKDGRREIVEAKFHNQNFGKTDVQVMLYTFARFLDVRKKNNIDGVWVATNTKLTSDAINYAKCKGIKALSWNFPQKQNIAEFVEKPKMYPITTLTDLTLAEERRFIDNGIVLASDLLKVSDEEFRTKYLIDEKRIPVIRESAELICG
ncbi:MAG: ATP-cone domain protein [Microgenomates group bacterium GW2011_GWC1_39_7]|nr:MAG: ATP-cone domain protein [Microgenomates group bacterium GW2011_GWC1_39_7]